LTHDIIQIGATGVIQIGIIAVSVLIAIFATRLILGKKYVMSADFKHGTEVLRRELGHIKHEFSQSIEALRQQSIDVAQTASKRARNISESLSSINSTWDARLVRLEEHADATAAAMAESQKQALEENERTADRLLQLEQRQMTLAARLERLDQNLRDQLSFIGQAIDEVRRREEDPNNSIEAINSALVKTQGQLDQLDLRLAREEKARSDIGTLMKLLAKRIGRVNLDSADTVHRVADLESKLGKELEERLGSKHEHESNP
jgi:chromosome segregation ATPase